MAVCEAAAIPRAVPGSRESSPPGRSRAGSAGCEAEGLAAVPAYATSRCQLPWLSDVAANGFSYPLLLPPVAADARAPLRSSIDWTPMASGGFSNIFSTRGRSKGASASEIHRDRQGQLAAALEESAAHRVTRSEWALAHTARLLGPTQVSHPSSAPPRTRPQASSIGLPQGWDIDTGGEEWDRAQDSLVAEVALRDRRDASPHLRPESRTSSGSRSPRNRALSPQGALLEKLSFAVPDNFHGPASVWHVSRRSPTEASLPHTAGALSRLDEALREFRSGPVSPAEVQRPPQQQNEDAVVAKAFAREDALKKAAEKELARTLQRLRELESAPSSEPAPASRPTRSRQGSAVATPKVQGTASSAATGQVAPAVAPSAPGQIAPGIGLASAQGLPASAALGQAALQDSSPEIHARSKAPALAHAAVGGPSSSGSALGNDPPATPTLSTDKTIGHMELHAQLIKKVKVAEEEVRKFKAQPAEKAFKLETRQTINKKVTQICANVKTIQECSRALCDLVGRTAENSSAERRGFTEYMLAYRFADEAEVAIRASAKAAWPVAHVAAQIFHKSPAIEELFQGFMHTHSPYLAPDYAGSQAGRSSSCPGQREEEPYADFVDRMVAYQRLWLAIAVVQDDLAVIWLWLARTVNATPCPIAASLLHCALDMAAFAAHKRYKRQFDKLVSCIEREYLPELEALRGKTSGEETAKLRASLSRLQVWLSDFARKGAEPPEGYSIEATEESALNPNI